MPYRSYGERLDFRKPVLILIDYKQLEVSDEKSSGTRFKKACFVLPFFGNVFLGERFGLCNDDRLFGTGMYYRWRDLYRQLFIPV
jgi:hypothetical protein